MAACTAPRWKLKARFGIRKSEKRWITWIGHAYHWLTFIWSINIGSDESRSLNQVGIIWTPGYRRFTYHLDRPDVMSKFTSVRLEADESKCPILLLGLSQNNQRQGQEYWGTESFWMIPSWKIGQLGLWGPCNVWSDQIWETPANSCLGQGWAMEIVLIQASSREAWNRSWKRENAYKLAIRVFALLWSKLCALMIWLSVFVFSAFFARNVWPFGVVEHCVFRPALCCVVGSLRQAILPLRGGRWRFGDSIGFVSAVVNVEAMQT